MAAYDENLAPEQFDSLNQTFYRGAPHEYIEQRLNSLILIVSESPHVAEAFSTGLGFGSLTVRGEFVHDPRESNDYAAIESVVLLHHAAEALLRLYFAHRDSSECPWLEVARLRVPSHFKKAVEAFLPKAMDVDEAVKMLTVFRGNTDPEPLGINLSPDEWSRQTTGLQMLMREAARRVLDEATMYNAAKHGLAVLSAEIGTTLSVDGLPEGFDISNQGPSLTYLDLIGSGQERRWAESLTWVNPEANMGLTFLIVRQIRALWNIARMRYTRSGEGERIDMVDPGAVESLTTGTWKKPIHIPGFSQTLLYYADETQ